MGGGSAVTLAHRAQLREILVRLALNADARDRHELMSVIAEEREPLRVLMRIQHGRLVVVEGLDLVLQEHRGETVLVRNRFHLVRHLHVSLNCGGECFCEAQAAVF